MRHWEGESEKGWGKVMDNIFSALIHKRDGGVIREFVLWCILCFETLLFMIVAIIAGSKITWIMLMVFTIGLAVLTAFRLTAVALLYSVGVFHLLTLTIHYICYRTSGSVMDLFLFVLLILLALAALICSFVHNLSRYDLDKVVMILVITDSVFIMILQILLYVGRRSVYGYLSGWMGISTDFRGYWLGIISFLILLAVIDLYYIFFVLGLIDNRWRKIIKKVRVPKAPAVRGVPAAIQGIRGKCAGQMVYIDDGGSVIGSDRSAGATLVLPDVHISRWHCAVRYDPGRSGNGFYEIFDRSMNGVYLDNGSRLPQNVWNRLPRGSVICIGGMEQRFRLL